MESLSSIIYNKSLAQRTFRHSDCEFELLFDALLWFVQCINFQRKVESFI